MLRRLFVSTMATASAVLLVTTGAFAAKPAPNQAPVVTGFDVPDSSASPIPVLTFTATDADGTVVGYLVTESPTRPDANAPGWSAAPPAEYATSSVGAITLYPWAKDNRDAVSSATGGDAVTVSQPPIDADTLDGMDSTEFAAAAHSHDPAYVNEGQVDSIASPMIVDGGVTGAKLAAGAVTEDKLAAGVSARIAAVEDLAAALQATISALQSQVTALAAENATQQSQIANLDARVALLESTPETALGNYVTIVTQEMDGLAGPHVVFHGANVHVRNDMGTSASGSNGLGNLILGYNEPGPGGTFGRGGSHNLVVGGGHQYDGVVGVVTGVDNAIAEIGSVALGGYSNAATGRLSSIVGGFNNTADAYYSAVFGGQGNASSGFYSAIVGGASNQVISSWDTGGFIGGGRSNVVSGEGAAILGGVGNSASGYGTVSGSQSSQAEGYGSTVSGGINNFASGDNCTVSGGMNNTATGYQASVSGGSGNTASGPQASVSGGYGNQASGILASISGGTENIASGFYSSITGGQTNTAGGSHTSVNGGLFNASIGMWTSVGGGLQNTAGGDKFTIGGGKFLDYTSSCIGGWAANGLYQCQ